MTEKHKRIFIGFFCSVIMSFPHIAMLCQNFIKILCDPVILFFHFSLSQDVIIPPAVKAVEIFDLRPVLGKPVPGNDLFPMKIRSSDLYVEFSQPLAFCSCSSVFLQCAGCGILCSSKRRNIKIPDIKSCDLFRKKFRFLPALFGQGIYCVIRVSMSYKK